MTFSLTPMTEAYAREIAGWRYEGEFALYNTASEDTDGVVRAFVDAQLAYFAVLDDEYGLSGFCCYGEDARVPGGDYRAEALDIGLGMRPDLVGRGMGLEFLQAIQNNPDRSDETPDALPLRATIASFNTRSVKVFVKAGYKKASSFTVPGRMMPDRPTPKGASVVGDSLEFVIMVKLPEMNQATEDLR